MFFGPLLTGGRRRRLLLTVGLAVSAFSAVEVSAQNPAGVTGAAAWYRADANITVSGSTITAWNNSVTGGAAGNLTPAASPQLISGAQNYNPSVLFAGTQYFTSAANALTAGTNYSKFVVFKYDNATNSNNLVSGNPGTGSTAFWGDGTSNSVRLWHNGATVLTGNLPGGTAAYNIATGVFSLNATNGSFINVNGTQQIAGTISSNYTAAHAVVLGAHGTGTNNLGGKIAEAIVYPSALSSADILKVESYLGIKYGLTLGHNYVSSAGAGTYTTTGYANAIAGIGRDDMGGGANNGLLQKQGSSNAATEVVMAVSSLAATNVANTGSFGTDQQFLIWGSNGASAGSYNTVGGITGVGYVSSMQLRIQNSGVTQSVQVLIPSIILSGFSSPSLVTSPDATFGNGNDAATAMTLTTVNGISYYACNFTFAAGTSYFTFGGTSNGPGGIGSCSMWVRADSAVTASAGNISAWTNIASTGNSFTGTGNPQHQSGAAYNFNPSVSFSGTNYLTSAAAMYPSNANYTKFAVFRYTSALSSNNILSNGGAGTSAFYGGTTVTDVNLFHNGNIATAPTSVNANGAFFLATGVFNSGVSNGTLINVDGIQKTAVLTSAAHVADVMQIGAFQSGAMLRGTVSEGLVYNGALTAADINKVESYLGLKYGITLGHNYVASDGTLIYDRSTYGTDIAGIGRDATMQLYQKQATTTFSNTNNQWWDVGSIVTMSMGAPAAQNSLNASSFSSDKNFLIWGNDNGTVSPAIVSGISGVSNRMTRIWKAAHTGSVGSVTVMIPATGVPLVNVHLLTSTTAAFGVSSTATPMTTVTFLGKSFYQATVTFPAGTSYFTFGGNPLAPGGVAGSNVWVKADAGVSTTGSNVTGWSNQVNAANNLTAAGTPVLSSSDINYNPSILFAGNSALNTASDILTANSNYTKFVIFKFDATSPNNILGANLTMATNGGSTLWGASSSTNLYLHHQDGGSNMTNIVSALNSVNTSRYFLASGVYNAGVSNGSFLNVDGTQAGVATVNSTYLNHPLSIGAFNGGNYLNGRVAEAIMYPTALSAANIERVESYLAVKYGMTLGHNYKASDGSTFYTVTGYGSNIGSIGRDDAAVLNQRQSQSSVPGTQIVMALGALQGTNAANSNSFSSDKQFLSWGDNGTTTGYVSQSGVAGVNLRTSRIWKIENTNSMGQAVQVLIPATSLSGMATPVLIRDNTSTFGGSSTVVALTTVTVNSTLYYTATFAWPAGVSYMTYGGTGNFPGGVQGAAIWVKANSGVGTSGSNVTTWTDYASGNSLAATGTPVLSANDINYNPSVTFGGGSYLTSGSNVLNASSNYSKFVVFKYDGAGTNNIVSGTSAGGNSTAFWGESTTTDLKLWHNGVNQLSALNSVSTARYFLGTGVFNSGVANGSFINVDGTLKIAGNVTTGYAAHAVQLGGYGNSSTLIGRIAEVIVFPTQLNAADINQVESYLGLKYGITLGHNYLSADGTTTLYNVSTYGNNIAGIGRDDISSQNQKQSSSLNNGANATMITMGINSIAASNAANSAAFSGDRAYILWGDNNAAVAETTTGLPGSQLVYNKRLGRSWKVQRTGTPGTGVQVKVNITGITTTGTTAPDFAILIDRDGDGNFSTGTYDAYQASSYSSGVLTFDNVQWDNDANGTDVFTVVTQVTTVNVNLTAYLEGAMPGSGTNMRNDIQAGTGGFTAPSLPTADPYGLGASYSQINNTSGPAGAVTDWVRVEVRSAAAPATVLQSRALLLKTDGSIVDVDGSMPRFNPQSGAVRIVIRHRNHLNVMGNNLAAFSSGLISYNFSTSMSQAYQYNNADVAPMKLVNGVWCLWAGDSNGDGYIDNADDKNVYNAMPASGSYNNNDVTLDGNINATDNTITNSNYGTGLYSPTVQY